MSTPTPTFAVVPAPDAAEPTPAEIAREAAAMAPPVGLMGVKELAENPGYGVISGSRAKGYSGGVVCDLCLTLVKMSGVFVPESETPSGAYIALTSRAAGLKCEGEIRTGAVRWVCPRCPKPKNYRQLALEVVSCEPDFRAVFVRRADGTATPTRALVEAGPAGAPDDAPEAEGGTAARGIGPRAVK